MNVAVSTIVGFDELPAARYDGGDAGAPLSRLKGTAIARMGVEDEAEVALCGVANARDKRTKSRQSRTVRARGECAASKSNLSERVLTL